jgi:hypothetical protein
MRLNREQSEKLLRELGIWVTGACDKCGQLLGSVRWTLNLKDGPGEWCSSGCRDCVSSEMPRANPKSCLECGVPLEGKRADSKFCAAAHRMRFQRKSRTGQNYEISANTPIQTQGLIIGTRKMSDRRITLTRPISPDLDPVQAVLTALRSEDAEVEPQEKSLGLIRRWPPAARSSERGQSGGRLLPGAEARRRADDVRAGD